MTAVRSEEQSCLIGLHKRLNASSRRALSPTGRCAVRTTMVLLIGLLIHVFADQWLLWKLPLPIVCCSFLEAPVRCDGAGHNRWRLSFAPGLGTSGAVQYGADNQKGLDDASVGSWRYILDAIRACRHIAPLDRGKHRHMKLKEYIVQYIASSATD